MPHALRAAYFDWWLNDEGFLRRALPCGGSVVAKLREQIDAFQKSMDFGICRVSWHLHDSDSRRGQLRSTFFSTLCVDAFVYIPGISIEPEAQEYEAWPKLYYGDHVVWVLTQGRGSSVHLRVGD